MKKFKTPKSENVNINQPKEKTMKNPTKFSDLPIDQQQEIIENSNKEISRRAEIGNDILDNNGCEVLRNRNDGRLKITHGDGPAETCLTVLRDMNNFRQICLFIYKISQLNPNFDFKNQGKLTEIDGKGEIVEDHLKGLCILQSNGFSIRCDGDEDEQPHIGYDNEDGSYQLVLGCWDRDNELQLLRFIHNISKANPNFDFRKQESL